MDYCIELNGTRFEGRITLQHEMHSKWITSSFQIFKWVVKRISPKRRWSDWQCLWLYRSYLPNSLSRGIDDVIYSIQNTVNGILKDKFNNFNTLRRLSIKNGGKFSNERNAMGTLYLSDNCTGNFVRWLHLFLPKSMLPHDLQSRVKGCAYEKKSTFSIAKRLVARIVSSCYKQVKKEASQTIKEIS